MESHYEDSPAPSPRTLEPFKFNSLSVDIVRIALPNIYLHDNVPNREKTFRIR